MYLWLGFPLHRHEVATKETCATLKLRIEYFERSNHPLHTYFCSTCRRVCVLTPFPHFFDKMVLYIIILGVNSKRFEWNNRFRLYTQQTPFPPTLAHQHGPLVGIGHDWAPRDFPRKNIYRLEPFEKWWFCGFFLFDSTHLLCFYCVCDVCCSRAGRAASIP